MFLSHHNTHPEVQKFSFKYFLPVTSFYDNELQSLRGWAINCVLYQIRVYNEKQRQFCTVMVIVDRLALWFFYYRIKKVCQTKQQME